MPRSVIGFLISGSYTAFSAVRTSSTLGICCVLVTSPMLRTGRRRLFPPALLRLPGLGIEIFTQLVELTAQVVAGGHLADRDPQRRDLPGQVLGVRFRLRGPVAILVERDPVTVVLAVL